MPDLETTDDLELDLEDGDDGDDASGDAGDAPKEPAKDEDKRIRDLQSAADKATARANKAEAELAKALGKGEGTGEGAPARDPERAALLSELREASLDAVYGEFPDLKRFGISRDLVEGQTRVEMRESATSLVTLVKSVETKARNAALKEHGITPEPAGATRQPPKSYDSMSDEDFEKEIARARTGGTSSLW